MAYTKFVYEEDTTRETWEEIYQEMSETHGMVPEPETWAVYTARTLWSDGQIDTSGASTITVLVWEDPGTTCGRGAAIKYNAYTEWLDVGDEETIEEIISGYYNSEIDEEDEDYIY